MSRHDAYEGLTDGQRQALQAMESGVNVFLTGHAGTGKSYVLDRFLELRRHSNMLVCAPTGIAALNLANGTTVHRAFKLRGQDVFDPTRLSHFPHRELLRADTIVIDEVSMLRVDLFDHIMSKVMAAERKNGAPKQVILVGDFCQLPPVMSDDEVMPLKSFYPNLKRGYCSDGIRWEQIGLRSFVLDEVVRQSDTELVAQLDKARLGDVTCLEYFNRFVRAQNDDEQTIKLVPRNAEAAAINRRELKKLSGRATKFHAVSAGTVGAGDKSADGSLSLKVGARVVSLINDREEPMRYQNGAMGKLLKVEKDAVLVKWDNGEETIVKRHGWEITRPVVREDAKDDEQRLDCEVIGVYEQLPLRLEYAITIHKSQGQTYERAHIDPSCFTAGQLYVALSRVRTSEGLSLSSAILPRHLTAAGEVVDFYRRLAGETVASQEDSVTMSVPLDLAPAVRALIAGRGRNLAATWKGSPREADVIRWPCE